MGEVAYELELSPGSRIHNALGQHITISPKLPPMDEEGKLILVPDEILEVRERRLRSRVIQEYLVRWRDLLIEDATWEGESIVQHRALQLLLGKHLRQGRTVMSPL